MPRLTKENYIYRAISIKLFPTKTKKEKVRRLIGTNRKVINKYLQIFYIQKKLNQKYKPKLDKDTLALVQHSTLSERQKSNALKEAIEIYKSNENKKKKTLKKNHAKRKVFSLKTDAKVIQIEENKTTKTFDLFLKISTLKKKDVISIPAKKTKILKRFIEDGWELCHQVELKLNKIIVCVRKELQYKNEGKVIGVDIGENKLLVTSELQHIGKDFKNLIDNVYKSKGKNKKRAIIKRNNYINEKLKEIDFSEISVIGCEELKFKKRWKHHYWVGRHILTRLNDIAQENRVRLVSVNPKNTSRTCPLCGSIDAKNRKGECFCCLTCGHTQDADEVGATNIFNRTTDYLRSVESLNPKGNI